MAQQRRKVSGRGHEGAVPGQIELDTEAAGEEAGIQVAHHLVGTGQEVARPHADGGVGVNGGAQLAHQGRGLDVVALDVADDRCGGCGAAADEVVEVAADIHAVSRGQVAGGGPQAGNGG
jgi:hypothetical protein